MSFQKLLTVLNKQISDMTDQLVHLAKTKGQLKTRLPLC